MSYQGNRRCGGRSSEKAIPPIRLVVFNRFVLGAQECFSLDFFYKWKLFSRSFSFWQFWDLVVSNFWTKIHLKLEFRWITTAAFDRGGDLFVGGGEWGRSVPDISKDQIRVDSWPEQVSPTHKQSSPTVEQPQWSIEGPTSGAFWSKNLRQPSPKIAKTKNSARRTSICKKNQEKSIPELRERSDWKQQAESPSQSLLSPLLRFAVPDPKSDMNLEISNRERNFSRRS